jgi:CubicO group peptidase (beta-lactamase class C family)
MKKALCVATLAIVLLPGGALGAPAADAFDATLKRVHEDPAPAAAALAIVHDGRIVYRHELGAASATSVFAIGSLTKMFTAVAVLQLVESGKIGLDTPIARWFPRFPHASDITIRMLLTHRSGIPDYLPRAIRTGLVARPTSPAQIVERAATWTPDFAPGTDWNYSNTGYLLAGLIVESVSGESLANYERSHIFAPAGMRATAIGRAPAGTVLATSPGAVTFGSGPGLTDPAWYFGCGDIIASADDIARFDIALLSGRLISPRTLATMMTVASRATFGRDLDDGLGLFIRHDDGRVTYGHHGGIEGYTADNQFSPAARNAIVVLQTGGADADDLLVPFLPDIVTRKIAAYPAVDPDPRLTEKIRRALNDLLAGEVDDGAFAPSLGVSDLLAAGKSIKGAYPGSSVTSLIFDGRLYDEGHRVVKYAAHFGATGAELRIILDPDGTIASFAFV